MEFRTGERIVARAVENDGRACWRGRRGRRPTHENSLNGFLRGIMNLSLRAARQTIGKKKNGGHPARDCRSKEPARRGGEILGVWVRGRGTASC